MYCYYRRQFRNDLQRKDLFPPYRDCPFDTPTDLIFSDNVLSFRAKSGLRRGTIIIFDEIHRLNDPSRVLKIAADAYPHLKVLATGSSTLAATRKFRDSLAGRKHMIYLPPALWSECLDEFGIKELDRRFLHGGLPEPLMSEKKDT